MQKRALRGSRGLRPWCGRKGAPTRRSPLSMQPRAPESRDCAPFQWRGCG
ncbi:hypothetical protein STRIP9103_08506 [Streptomyces ipomoeae 91-03]|uniref:Uncharacterized protein n=1 Tax=Streptomyces ipomoeae 91-03 TaxID=698759 RepID=L1KW12_9ACTN|nr:hypothetical protein STRIP9103_08506 [Streptomyces ipomoeae 91-03]